MIVTHRDDAATCTVTDRSAFVITPFYRIS